MVRYKNRYITIQVSSKKEKFANKPLNLKPQAVHEAIQKKVLEMYGDYGIAAIKAGFSAKYCNAHTRIALIKIRHGPHMFLLKALPKINDVGGNHVNVKIMYIGATMKHCFIFIKNYQREKLQSMWKEMKNDNERKELEKALMTMDPAMKDLL
ncbi:uncharacterized protein LOC100680529 [Nasonia vitripennis]|uniref:Ribonuclease P/MRP protein subunit POP5 n=1 Tax=Nasonia vitripennis TaxID=7425 RepID=A0A7M7Q3C3_NASVI|nr:uncharacterized protein LOC100680529 [Nasonia vitripennis]XP_031779614.1 uncharacterized protein LOC100680529 [Nasonia vitripennis]XP_031779615.1 uncharacterized protein LOC100680529 [Nasonia vitripennis]